MGTKSKDGMKAMIAKDVLDIHNRCNEVKKSINDSLKETLQYFHALIAQIPQSTSGPLIAKTPKVLRTKGVQRIETIPEDDVVETDYTMSDSVAVRVTIDKLDLEETSTAGRSKRAASRKAATNIKKQQSLSIHTKLRRPSNGHDENVYLSETFQTARVSRSKRKKSERSSSEEEHSRGRSKYSKIDDNKPRESTVKNAVDQKPKSVSPVEKNTTDQENNDMATIRRSHRKKSSTQNQAPENNKTLNLIDETVIAPTADDVEEPSLYEDAICKPTPIMNSTMNFNSTITLQRMMNATVVLEPLPVPLNETVTIVKKFSNSAGKKSLKKEEVSKSLHQSKIISPPRQALQDKMQQLKNAMVNKEFDDLLTDDESSPEIKKSKQLVKKQEERKRTRRVVRSISSSDDEVLNTPAKPIRGINPAQELRSAYKSNALFSPYAKESVKKRVEAFEQAGLNSPKHTVEIDAPTRITRTKTRAIAKQAEASEMKEKTVAQKLARKSLAKAKKISLAKVGKDVDEYKENKMQAIQKASKVPIQKTTPLGKSKMPLPMSVSRIPQTPANAQYPNNHTKVLSATRGNIITTMDSFLQAPKTASKPNSSEKMDERKRKQNDEDARSKREEALRLQTEEKRRKRQEKELKNKLAREAKEKQDMEKRQKAEKEREEKARLAQQMQEKQREELEKKRLAQLQRAQEKEERRKHEEQMRLQRLQEQEEAERILAEQRRREQEAEKRKEADARAQQHAAAEAARIKSQMLAAQAKYASKKNGPTNYILDSEPDDDESDDETRPKHEIPYWSLPTIRKFQLATQRYIPEKAVFKFFDSKKCTPDLTELFHGIDRSRLKRTSSAIWKTPPRYSMMVDE